MLPTAGAVDTNFLRVQTVDSFATAGSDSLPGSDPILDSFSEVSLTSSFVIDSFNSAVSSLDSLDLGYFSTSA